MPERPFLLYAGIRSRYKNTELLLHAYAGWRHRSEVEVSLEQGVAKTIAAYRKGR